MVQMVWNDFGVNVFFLGGGDILLVLSFKPLVIETYDMKLS